MKKYLKPNLNLVNISVNENIASLNDWLVNNGLEDYEATITTYEYKS